MLTLVDANIPCSAFKTHPEGHEAVKSEFIKTISVLKKDEYKDLQTISRSDWRDTPKNSIYPDAIEQNIIEHIQQVKIKLNLDNYWLQNCWFQQYKTGDFHGWHVHAKAMFAGVYYIELPKDSEGTLFSHINKEFYLPTTEGDIISFPTFVRHCSVPNKSLHTKTIIAFNYDVF